MERIIITLGKRSYPVNIASGLLDGPEYLLPLRAGNQVMLITNKTIASIYINKVCNLLDRIGVYIDSLIFPDGEQYKNLTTLNVIFTKLLQKSHGRDTTLIALGGGVIGDLTGFAAASYQRGVRFIQIPTTLLSQADSSVGGKTAVNHLLGKNMIGAFWQPVSVISDLDCLKTLPLREISSGLAEVIKYSIIFDSKFFNWLENNIDSLLYLEESKIAYCIRRCCELKAKIITIDEREKNHRTLLNLGHTYAHIIEVEMGYGNWLHGEAVSVGIVMAARTSELLGQLKHKETQRIITLLQHARLPIMGPKEISAQTYLKYMIHDKKTLSRKIRLVLPLTIGKSKVCSGISNEIILNAISSCC